MAGGSPWLRAETGSVVLTLHVQPGASRTEVAGAHGDALKIRLAAPPVEGRANDALVAYLSDAFGVPRASVTLLRGAASRRKIVRIDRPAKRPDLAWARDAEDSAPAR